MSGMVLVLSGPSGVGKGAVHAQLRTRIPHCRLSVSVTTRPPRDGETDGVDYVFVDEARFTQLVADGAFLEHATYAGHRYGTLRAQVAEGVAAGDLVILDIEVQGALQVKDALDDRLLVFLAPPSMAELEARLRARGTEDERAVARRMQQAVVEIDQQDAFDVVIVNDDLDRCVNDVIDAIDAWRAARKAAATES